MHVSTRIVGRQNPTKRMHMRRFARLTKAFSMNGENHAHAVAPHIMFHNFACAHASLRVTPAMATAVTDGPWQFDDVV